MVPGPVTDNLPFAEACERNKAPILEVLRRVLPERGHVIEVGSGTGQHVVHFAPSFPRLSWQPTELADNLGGLNARIRQQGDRNILPALALDVEAEWPDRQYVAAYSANTAHILSWAAVSAMVAGIGERLVRGGVFCLYGPFNVGGRYTSPGNETFDKQLREAHPAMGLRDVEALVTVARNHGLELRMRSDLPANNQMLVFQSTGVG